MRLLDHPRGREWPPLNHRTARFHPRHFVTCAFKGSALVVCLMLTKGRKKVPAKATLGRTGLLRLTVPGECPAEWKWKGHVDGSVKHLVTPVHSQEASVLSFDSDQWLVEG